MALNCVVVVVSDKQETKYRELVAKCAIAARTLPPEFLMKFSVYACASSVKFSAGA